MLRLGYSIRILREARGLTSARLATEAQISPTYLSLIEAGERVPPPATLEQLAGVLNVDVAVLQVFLPTGGIPPRNKTIRCLVDSLQRIADATENIKQQLA